ncbi:MAG: hypothetical protein EOO07_35950 [Chitinophagaceae bacterium]|nr:MAG: hypothetical protein EOO07_35950 [Chitinophagaceae bacterium]
MGIHVPFPFRNKPSTCTIYIDSSTRPCYVFVCLNDRDLIHEFGEEITVKTDFTRRLPKKDDYPALVVLRDAIFNAIKELPEFIAKRRLVNSLANYFEETQGN